MRINKIRLVASNLPDNELFEYDELSKASKISKYLNTKHSELRIGSDEVINEIDKMVYYLDEPYAGGLPSWFIYKYASK